MSSDNTNNENPQPALKIINWEEAKVQVGDDEEFLKEVLADLISESESGIQDITSAIEAKDFEKVMKSSHKIKGSTSYLCCEITNNIARNMEYASAAAFKKTTDLSSEDSWKKINELFDTFKVAFEELKKEIT
eukprot:TRINITY_DN45290_c0_g1_i2.p1 TRINITY_DN45290_c0_g1~~TRINITY_DN45290_c0_g1_i2.p1  ORF type:complete len:133 (-),score=11.92 TRINITY_DN45290_c0_g1_i2:166-564(-)